MNRLYNYILSLSIHIKLAVIIFFIVSFISLSTVLIALNISNNQTKEVASELINSTIKTNEESIISSIFANDSWKLYKFLKALSENSIIVNAGIIDNNNHIIAYSNPKVYKLDDTFKLNDSYKIVDIKSNNILLGQIVLEIENTAIDKMIKKTFFSNVLFLILAGVFSFIIANLFIKKLLGRFQLVINNMNAISKREWNLIKQSDNTYNDEFDKLIQHSVLLMHDIKDSLEKEESLRLFYHNILKSIDSFIIICDENLTLHYHNNHKLCKYILDEKKIALQDFILKDLLIKSNKHSVTIKLSDAKVKYLFVNIHKINNRVVVYFSDITQLKEIEERGKIIHSLEVMGEISSQFAHEVKNLLQPLTLLIPKETPPDKEDLEIIHTVLAKMKGHVSDFLFLGKPVELMDNTAENPKAILKDLLMVLDNKINNKKLTIADNIDENLNILFNKKYIELILINLITNAIDAAFLNTKITISWKNDTEFNILEIENTGENIKNIDKIFKPFYTTKKEGSGLGLFSIYKIIYTAKGKIDVTSENNITKFTIYIPNRID